jgi:hypothetical protein
MGELTQLFSISELEELDEKQLTILRDALLSEIRYNADIRAILSTRLRDRYAQFTRQARPGRARGSGSPRTPRSR